MPPRDAWPLAWIVAAVANGLGVVGGIVAGNWYAVTGWACATLAALGAAGAGAALVRLQRDTAPPTDYGNGHPARHRINPNHPGWEDHPDDGRPRPG